VVIVNIASAPTADQLASRFTEIEKGGLDGSLRPGGEKGGRSSSAVLWVANGYDGGDVATFGFGRSPCLPEKADDFACNPGVSRRYLLSSDVTLRTHPKLSDMNDLQQRRECFVDLLARSQSRIMGYIYCLVHDFNDTEDLYQQTCLVMWRKFDEYEQGTQFLQWALRIAHFEVTNCLRQRRRRTQFSQEFLAELSAEPDLDPVGDEDARVAALRHCLKELKTQDLNLLDHRYGLRKRLSELAGELGRSPQSVSNTLGRIRLTLLNCMRRVRLAEEGA
jgi:RNA polymerase sigma-70 factor (ECF subfamily)